LGFDIIYLISYQLYTYSWNTGSADNSVAQWNIIGLEAAEARWGIHAPDWVKSELEIWLTYSQYLNPSSWADGGFGYSSSGGTYSLRTGAGICGLNYLGYTSDYDRIARAVAYLDRRWNDGGNFGNYYGMYAIMKGLRTTQPQITQVGSHDWYAEQAEWLVDHQNNDGSWNQQWGGVMSSAWSILILTPTVFEPPPVADAGAEETGAIGLPVNLDGSGSYHMNLERNLILYEWDFDDSDGLWWETSATPDWVSPIPEDVVAYYSAYGDFTVTLRVTDDDPTGAKTDTDTTVVHITPPPHPPIADPNGPYLTNEGQAVVLDGSASWDPDEFDPDFEDSIIEWGWELDLQYPYDFDDGLGQYPQWTWTEPGTYNIGLRVKDTTGLTDTAWTSVTVEELPYEVPIADPNGPYTAGEGTEVVFDGTGSTAPGDVVARYDWDLDGDGDFETPSAGPNPTFTWYDDHVGTVGLMVQNSMGLWSEAVYTDIIINNVDPVVDAGEDQTEYEGVKVFFSGSIDDPGSEDTHTIEWDFGDGNTASGSLTPDHTYLDDGVFTVTLTVTDDDGGVGTDTLTVIVVDAAPTAEFTWEPEPQDEGSPVQFTDASTSYPDEITGWSWNFAGLGTSNDPNPEFTFMDDGVYTVSLTVTDDDGTSDTVAYDVTILDLPPLAEFSWAPEPQDEGAPVQFTDESTSYPDDIVAWDWNFAGLGTSAEQNPEFIFMDDGTYTVILTVTDEDGTTNTTYHAVTILDLAPTADFTWAPEPQDEGTPVQFTDASTSYPDDIVGWDWDFAGLGSSDAQNPEFIFMDDGVYTVTLTVTDDDGSMDTIFYDVTILDLGPTAIIGSPDTFDEGYHVPFEDLSTSYPDEIVGWEWDFGDGNTSIEQNPPHMYGDNGEYTVTLTVTDDDGSTDTTTFVITILNVAPDVDAGDDQEVDENTLVYFKARWADPGIHDTHTITWDFGDGTTYTGTDPDVVRKTSHEYGDNGAYIVRCTFVDDDGGVGFDELIVTVNNVAPTIEPFGPFSADENTPLEVGATATDPGSDDLTFTWEFENGPTITHVYYNNGETPDEIKSNEVNPMDISDLASHIYGDNGIYRLTLTVEDDDGGVTVHTTVITINNVDPTIGDEDVRAYAIVEFSIRLAGSKWSNVELTIYEDDNPVGFAEMERWPGDPDDNPWIGCLEQPLLLDMTKTITAVMTYDPYPDDGDAILGDQPNNGKDMSSNAGNPVWLNVTLENGSWVEFKHTFNTEQSMIRDSEHPNHVEPWVVTINPLLVGQKIHFEASASDPGSDDLTFAWDFGDGNTQTTTYYNNAPANTPDMPQSPEVNPIDVNDYVDNPYQDEGDYTVVLEVTDDDGGSDTVSMEIILSGPPIEEYEPEPEPEPEEPEDEPEPEPEDEPEPEPEPEDEDEGNGNNGNGNGNGNGKGKKK